jgi:energy-converting hydrogenase Eha subunit H
VAILFMVALHLFCAATVILGRDGMISIHEHD